MLCLPELTQALSGSLASLMTWKTAILNVPFGGEPHAGLASGSSPLSV